MAGRWGVAWNRPSQQWGRGQALPRTVMPAAVLLLPRLHPLSLSPGWSPRLAEKLSSLGFSLFLNDQCPHAHSAFPEGLRHPRTPEVGWGLQSGTFLASHHRCLPGFPHPAG